MKLLMVGNQKYWALEMYYYKHIQAYIDDVFFYPSASIFQSYYSKNFANKLLFRSGFSNLYQKINQGLLEKAEETKPDIVWVFKGVEIFPATLKALKQKGIVLVNFNADHPFVFVGRGSGNKNITQSIPLYDLHLSYHSGVVEKIKSKFKIPTYLLPFGYELSVNDFEKSIQQREVSKASFMGHCDKQRVNFIKAVVQAGIEVDVYGVGWKKYLKSRNGLTIQEAAYGTTFSEKLRQYRVQFNLFRSHNIGTHNMRSFEVPAVGGIMLAPDSPDHHRYFQPEENIFLYQSTTEAIAKAKQLLRLSQEEALSIRAAARKQSIEKKYSYADRAGEVYQVFNSTNW